MRFTELEIPGVFAVDVEPREDERGFFTRAFCEDELVSHGLVSRMVQANLSFNHVAGTLRGMHLQVEPHGEAKLVRVIHGAIYDVAVDMRPDSPTYLAHVGVELSAQNRRALYVPPGFVHGYQTLTDGAEVLYQVSERYAPGFERGFRYDDPAFAIAWPVPVSTVSEKDAAWALLAR